MRFRRCLLLLPVLTCAAVAGATCAQDLVEGLRAHVGRAPVVRSDEDMGLPMNNLKAKSDPLGTGFIYLATDLGPSLWTPAEWTPWLALAPHLRDPAWALMEVNKITGAKDYCTPGVLPSLCEHLRTSREIYEIVQRELPMPEIARVATQARIYGLRMRAMDRAHDRRDVLRFPWGHAPARGEAMNQHHALRILRTFARETLVRHLIVRDSNKRLTLGRALPLEDRLLFAAYPHLTPLLGFALRFPFAREAHLSVGEMDEARILLRVPMEVGHRVRALMELTFQNALSLEPSAVARVRLIEAGASDAIRELARAEFGNRVARLGREFASFIPLSRGFGVQTRAESARSFVIDTPDLSQTDAILFFYFVAHRLSDTVP